MISTAARNSSISPKNRDGARGTSPPRSAPAKISTSSATTATVGTTNAARASTRREKSAPATKRHVATAGGQGNHDGQPVTAAAVATPEETRHPVGSPTTEAECQPHRAGQDDQGPQRELRSSA